MILARCSGPSTQNLLLYCVWVLQKPRVLPWTYSQQQYLCMIFSFTSWSTMMRVFPWVPFGEREQDMLWLEGKLAHYCLSLCRRQVSLGQEAWMSQLCFPFFFFSALFSYEFQRIARFFLNLSQISVLFVLLCDHLFPLWREKNNFGLDWSVVKFDLGFSQSDSWKFEIETLSIPIISYL